MRDRSLWTWHILAGLVILVFLGLHMLIMHLNATVHVGNVNPHVEAEDWVNVAARMRSLFFAVTYVVLLGAALYHGLYGFRNILFELNPGAGLRRLVNVAFTLGGLALFAFGTWAALASPGAAMRMGG
jgi:succinate dehydrogenase hydrophobic anchor subunit